MLQELSKKYGGKFRKSSFVTVLGADSSQGRKLAVVYKKMQW
jgi:hypothetical protein